MVRDMKKWNSIGILIKRDGLSVPPLINEKEEVATMDIEKAEVLSDFFALVLAGCQSF